MIKKVVLKLFSLIMVDFSNTKTVNMHGDTFYKLDFKSRVFSIFLDSKKKLILKIPNKRERRGRLYAIYSLRILRNLLLILTLKKKNYSVYINFPQKQMFMGKHISSFINGYELSKIQANTVKSMELNTKIRLSDSIYEFISVLDKEIKNGHIIGDWYMNNLVYDSETSRILNIDWEGFIMHPWFSHKSYELLKMKLIMITELLKQHD